MGFVGRFPNDRRGIHPAMDRSFREDISSAANARFDTARMVEFGLGSNAHEFHSH